ncbi:MAG: rRNA maturation RNase YbeY [Aphanocapsa feldmannii 277cV]|uniref:Endoribonuclease YbeY n=2 Tax=Aphanocapsa feldmannii TaxID=192050 RepID=A0A524RMM8_9CHRO|nr:MAG: rRNA maturation RNase YbeY [Aphanocapsa feldmannii 288cV]TGG90943.1 MAG: rRNA maturation RNase YbeY [Aphanocapsa feldmannii 277cV]TGH27325.1 MAG: rRNA maturation RNase YbeY [Aphanocapsa feldmannii 277cI]
MELAFCLQVAPTAPLSLPWSEAQLQKLLQLWLRSLQQHLPDARRRRNYAVSLRVVGDADIAALNREWRQRSGATDVLAFAALDDPMPWPAELAREPLDLGDMVISLETAARQARQQGWGLDQEFAWLLAHGLLHLLGWDHPDEEALGEMLSHQQGLLEMAGVVHRDEPGKVWAPEQLPLEQSCPDGHGAS